MSETRPRAPLRLGPAPAAGLPSSCNAAPLLTRRPRDRDLARRSFVRYSLAIRLGRFGRLLAIVGEVKIVVATFMRMLPAAAKLLQVLFVSMFCFAQLGQQLFGGLINRVEEPQSSWQLEYTIDHM